MFRRTGSLRRIPYRFVVSPEFIREEKYNYGVLSLWPESPVWQIREKWAVLASKYFLNLSFIHAFVIFHLGLILEVEFLSVFNELRIVPFAFCTFINLILCVYSFQRSSKEDLEKLAPLRTPTKFAILLVALISFFQGILIKPNNWDSMTYHLPRIEHWISQANVNHFPTSVSRQNSIPPVGDYFTLVPRIFSGNDLLDFFPSFFAFLILVISLRFLIKSLAIRGIQADLMIILALTPSLVTQISTTQVDIRGIAFLVSGLSLLSSKIKKFNYVGLAAIIISIAIKPTNLLFMLPFLLIPQIRRVFMQQLFPKRIFASLILFIFVNSGWILRNFDTFGNVSGKPEISKMLIDFSLNPGVIFARLILSLGSNIGIPGLTIFNRFIQGIEAKLIDPLNLSTKSDLFPYGFNPRTIVFGVNEDVAANLVFAIFLLSGFIILLLNRKYSHFLKLFLILALPFFIVAWQPWLNRLLLPVILALTIIVIQQIYPILSRKKSETFLIFLASVMFLSSISYMLLSTSRGLTKFSFSEIGSSRQYFYTRPNLLLPYVAVHDYLSSNRITRVKIVGNEDSWEYPLIVQNRNVNFSWNDEGTRFILCLAECSHFENSSSKIVSIFDKNLILYKK